jgi:hypothetical protein
VGINDFNNWSIDKGDYLRDEETTLSYQRKINKRRKIKFALLTLIYLVLITAITYLISANI